MAMIPPEPPTPERLRRLGSKTTYVLATLRDGRYKTPFDPSVELSPSFLLHHAARFDPST